VLIRSKFNFLCPAKSGDFAEQVPVKANASMDSLKLKVPKEDLETHLHQLRHISRMDKPHRQAKDNKAPKTQQTLSANK